MTDTETRPQHQNHAMPPLRADRCETTDSSGKQTVRWMHYYQRRDGVWVCANCKEPRP